LLLPFALVKDLADLDAARAVFDAARTKLGQADTLINAAWSFHYRLEFSLTNGGGHYLWRTIRVGRMCNLHVSPGEFPILEVTCSPLSAQS